MLISYKVKDTHRENTPSNKTEALYEKYKYVYLSNWYIKSTEIQLKLNWNLTQFVLTLAFDRPVLYGNVAVSFLVVWTKKKYPVFQEKF